MSNVIPPITDPMGAYWAQPAIDDILVSNETAVMSLEAFDTLTEYSTTVPTGVYPGKMWKAEMTPGQWYLRWYGLVPGDDSKCSNNQRLIQIMDWKTLMGIPS
ncbi:hypothetical protein SB861_37530 [Paraburkholderia sp. SIMBA_049]